MRGAAAAWRRLKIRSARLPWKELEAEARRQGCSPADIFYDRAGRGRGAALVREGGKGKLSIPS
jgi:hypothetical protein